MSELPNNEDPYSGWWLGLFILIGVFIAGFSLGWFLGWAIP